MPFDEKREGRKLSTKNRNKPPIVAPNKTEGSPYPSTLTFDSWNKSKIPRGRTRLRKDSPQIHALHLEWVPPPSDQSKCEDQKLLNFQPKRNPSQAIKRDNSKLTSQRTKTDILTPTLRHKSVNIKGCAQPVAVSVELRSSYSQTGSQRSLEVTFDTFIPRKDQQSQRDMPHIPVRPVTSPNPSNRKKSPPTRAVLLSPVHAKQTRPSTAPCVIKTRPPMKDGSNRTRTPSPELHLWTSKYYNQQELNNLKSYVNSNVPTRSAQRTTIISNSHVLPQYPVVNRRPEMRSASATNRKTNSRFPNETQRASAPPASTRSNEFNRNMISGMTKSAEHTRRNRYKSARWFQANQYKSRSNEIHQKSTPQQVMELKVRNQSPALRANEAVRRRGVSRMCDTVRRNRSPFRFHGVNRKNEKMNGNELYGGNHRIEYTVIDGRVAKQRVVKKNEICQLKKEKTKLNKSTQIYKSCGPVLDHLVEKLSSSANKQKTDLESQTQIVILKPYVNKTKENHKNHQEIDGQISRNIDSSAEERKATYQSIDTKAAAIASAEHRRMLSLDNMPCAIESSLNTKMSSVLAKNYDATTEKLRLNVDRMNQGNNLAEKEMTVQFEQDISTAMQRMETQLPKTSTAISKISRIEGINLLTMKIGESCTDTRISESSDSRDITVNETCIFHSSGKCNINPNATMSKTSKEASPQTITSELNSVFSARDKPDIKENISILKTTVEKAKEVLENHFNKLPQTYNQLNSNSSRGSIKSLEEKPSKTTIDITCSLPACNILDVNANEFLKKHNFESKVPPMNIVPTVCDSKKLNKNESIDKRTINECAESKISQSNAQDSGDSIAHRTTKSFDDKIKFLRTLLNKYYSTFYKMTSNTRDNSEMLMNNQPVNLDNILTNTPILLDANPATSPSNVQNQQFNEKLPSPSDAQLLEVLKNITPSNGTFSSRLRDHNEAVNVEISNKDMIESPTQTFVSSPDITENDISQPMSQISCPSVDKLSQNLPNALEDITQTLDISRIPKNKSSKSKHYSALNSIKEEESICGVKCEKSIACEDWNKGRQNNSFLLNVTNHLDDEIGNKSISCTNDISNNVMLSTAQFTSKSNSLKSTQNNDCPYNFQISHCFWSALDRLVECQEEVISAFTQFSNKCETYKKIKLQNNIKFRGKSPYDSLSDASYNSTSAIMDEFPKWLLSDSGDSEGSPPKRELACCLAPVTHKPARANEPKALAITGSTKTISRQDTTSMLSQISTDRVSSDETKTELTQTLKLATKSVKSAEGRSSGMILPTKEMTSPRTSRMRYLTLENSRRFMSNRRINSSQATNSPQRTLDQPGVGPALEPSAVRDQGCMRRLCLTAVNANVKSKRTVSDTELNKRAEMLLPETPLEDSAERSREGQGGRRAHTCCLRELKNREQLEFSYSSSSDDGGPSPLCCPDARCGTLLSPLTLLAHLSVAHESTPSAVVSPGRPVCLALRPDDLLPSAPSIAAYLHVSDRMQSGPFILMVASARGYCAGLDSASVSPPYAPSSQTSGLGHDISLLHSSSSGVNLGARALSPPWPDTTLIAWLVEMQARSRCTVRILRRCKCARRVRAAASYTGRTVALRRSQRMSDVLATGAYVVAHPQLLARLQQDGGEVEVTATVLPGMVPDSTHRNKSCGEGYIQERSYGDYENDEMDGDGISPMQTCLNTQSL